MWALVSHRSIELGSVRRQIPIKIGLSAADYYEFDDVDNKFGFFSTAGLVTVPVGSNWNIHWGVEVQMLGDTTKAINGKERAGDD